MAKLGNLDFPAVRSVLVHYHTLLVAFRDYLNLINVYPVADGDTGSNLERTLRTITESLDSESVQSMRGLWRVVEKAALEGAHGTSGIVVAHMAVAVAQNCRDDLTVTPTSMALGLSRAAEAAYAAVLEPVEGTILTVVREAAEAAVQASDSTLLAVVDAARSAAVDSVARSTELVPALTDAGVPDAGGAGFALLFDSLLHVIAGAELPKPRSDLGPPRRPGARSGRPRYEVVMRLVLDDDARSALEGRLTEIGDEATVLARGAGFWLAHVHTETPDEVIEAAEQTAGAVEDVRVTELP